MESKIAEHFEAKKYAYRQTKDGVILSFVLHPDDVPKEMALANIGQRYMVACAQIDDFENPIRPAAVTEGERAVARANLICRDASYQSWVRRNRGEWPDVDFENTTDEEYAAQVIRSVCNVESRSELKYSETARTLLSDHMKEFERSL